MNARYRKARRLKSRHHRRGHTPWCQCPELWQSFAISLQRWIDSGRPLPRVTVRMTEADQ